ncbi:adenosine deaminase AGSA [Patella vulgata]|uniref:adenosine deaminase AGSA n=1 Tax=Patella vulgata TaxID=6465 RepID=UPI00217F3C4E|nr:adenosine deaminase AGSA [Patella vulgata]
MLKEIFILCLTIIHGEFVSCVPDSYQTARDAILKAERQQRLGSQIELNSAELALDKFLLQDKQTTIENARVGGSDFPPSINFFQSKKWIDDSPVFKVIEKMPKGCALHVHDSSITSLDWIISNVTYRANCYICFNQTTGSPSLHFFNKPPVNKGCEWELISTARTRIGNDKTFDQQLFRNLSIIVDNPDDAYVTVNDVWKKFSKYFGLINGVLYYAPVFKDYFHQALVEFYQDNVQCLEVRAGLPQVYELNGTVRDQDWVVQAYQSISTEFTKQNPNFWGTKIIYSGIRFNPVATILNNVKDAMRLMKAYPDFVVGYDLVGQEGIGNTLLYYIDDLLYPSQQQPPVHLPYFFHGGETDWKDTRVDENLIDAILLNTSRIGHAFALNKHPYIMQVMSERGIAVEVNPISNQVLKLVADIRNHPAALLMTGKFPVVVSSDDPAVWNAKPLSHDFYMAFMALAGEDEGIKILKQLAINSIKFSAMTDKEKKAALASWNVQWDKFINDWNTYNNNSQHVSRSDHTVKIIG